MGGTKFEMTASDADLRRLATVVEDSNDAITVQDLGGRILEWNRGAERMYGYSRAEALGMNIAALVPNEDRAQARGDLEAIARGEKVPSIEVRRLAKDGRTLDVWLTTTVLVDDEGRATSVATTERDIGDHRRSMQALRESEERFRAFVTASSDVVYRMSPDWSEMLELHGRQFIPDTDTPRRGWLEKYIHPDDQPHVMAVIREAIRTKSVFQLEHRVLRVDGSLGWTFSRAIPVFDASGEIVEWFGAASDVTARKQAEEALREDEERLKQYVDLLEHAPVLVRGPDDRITVWNEGMERLYGWRRGEAIGRISHELLRTRFSQPLAAIGATLERTGRWEGELHHHHRDGSEVIVESRWILHRDRDGVARAVVEVNADVTGRRRAEAALRDNEERLRLFVEHAPAAVAMFDRDMRYLAASRRFLTDYRLSRQDIVGRSHYELFPEITDRWKQVHRRCLAGAIESCEEDQFPREDGTLDWVRWEIRPWHTAAGEIGGLILFSEVITERKRSLEALRDSEERFRLLVRGVKDFAIYMLGVDGAVKSWSAAAEQIFGYREEEILGQRRSIFFTDEERAKRRPERDLEEALANGTSEAEGWRVRKDGSRFWANVLLTALRDDAGELRGFANVTRDVTERKAYETALRDSEERLRLAQEVARVGTFRWDIESGVNTWTPALEALYGLPPGGFGGTEAAFEEMIHPEDRGQVLRWVERAMETGAPAQGEWRVVWPDGTVHWIAGRWQVLKDRSGKPVRMTGINLDITEQKRSEELRASEAALREADRQKDRFLAMLSHELRNPLAPIRNSLYILDHAAPGGEQAMRAKAILHRQVGQLTWLIDDLLDVTRITHGKVELQRERLDLNELAHRAAEDQRSVFVKGEVRLEVLPAPAEVWVNGDRVRLTQVMGNLLQNAAKFTPRGGKTTVSLDSDTARGEAILTVRDTGSGIAPEMLPRLFQAFTQADATLDRSKGGLGLGLALVKGLVELHGGAVSASSDGVGEGAAFAIRLPLDVATAGAVGRLGTGGLGAPRRVLVVEDNEDAADSLREVLELDEHVVEVAYSGREGIEKARSFHPDVVLCDIGLPEMDGYEVARTLRADPELRRIGLVAVSGYTQPEDVAMAKKAGFDAHLAKPPSVSTLELAVEEAGALAQSRSA